MFSSCQNVLEEELNQKESNQSQNVEELPMVVGDREEHNIEF